MSWFIVDDDAHTHPKFIAAGNAAIGLWTRCGAYSSKYGLGGHVPTEIARAYGRPAEIAALVRVGLWDPAEGGYQFHDWDDRNDTAEQARAKRDKAADRQRRWRDKHAGVKSGVTRDETRDETRESQDSDPTRPDPSTDVLKFSDDDDLVLPVESSSSDYDHALNLVVASLASAAGKSTHRGWITSTKANQGRENGPAIRAALDQGATPVSYTHLTLPTNREV